MNWVSGVGSISQFPSRKKIAEEDKRHVLIVEDNELVTDALRILFEETGRRVTVAHSVADAIRVGSLDPPDLLLLDMRLPDGEGLDVARTLSANGVVPKATIALTGQDDPAVAERCAAAGCSAVLVKPVATRDLLEKAKEWLA